MASSSLSPSSSPDTVVVNSTNIPPIPTPSTQDKSTTSLPPIMSQPNATSDPPPPTSSSNSSSPPPVVSAAPPTVSLSPPPTTPVLSPPVPPTTTPVLTPPPTTAPIVDPPPLPSPPAPRPVSSPPPPTVVSPPPPSTNNSPPPISSTPPAAKSPPPQAISPPPPTQNVSVPPPADSPPLPTSSPPPPLANPPKSSPVPPLLTPPPPSVSRPTSPPSADTPPAVPSPPINQTQPRPSSPSPPLPPTSISPTVAPTQPSPTQPFVAPPNGSANPSFGAPENANTRSSGGISNGGTVALVLVSVIVVSLIGLAVWYMRKQKKKATRYNAGHVRPSPLGTSPVSDRSDVKAYSLKPLIGRGSGSGFAYSPQDSGLMGNSRSCFTYEELVGATNGFSEQNLLGEGGFGCVYKGILADGRDVAVKQLKIGGSQGDREFRAEVETISRVHHKHLVSLVGYCISDHQRLLVYDYVPNNTLYYHLHAHGRPVMEWRTRVKVATGAARGISYLHEDCHPRIIHRDIKSANILIDNDFEAQVADFGLAKLAGDTYTHISTRVMGTFGYMAPEYASSGKLTEKSDVYSFGVVLLELITGRKPVDGSQPLGDENLVEWARPLMSNALVNKEFEGLLDPRLEKNYVEHEVIHMIEAAAVCVRHSAVKRPRMGQVVRAFEAIAESSDLTNGILPGQSEVFNSTQKSEEIRLFRRMAFGSQDYSSSDLFSREL